LAELKLDPLHPQNVAQARQTAPGPAADSLPLRARRLNAYQLENVAAMIRCITAVEIYRVSGQLPDEYQTSTQTEPKANVASQACYLG
jgi:hypothetical protein